MGKPHRQDCLQHLYVPSSALVRIWYTYSIPDGPSLGQKKRRIDIFLFQCGLPGMQADEIDAAVERLRLFIPVLQWGSDICITTPTILVCFQGCHVNGVGRKGFGG